MNSLRERHGRGTFLVRYLVEKEKKLVYDAISLLSLNKFRRKEEVKGIKNSESTPQEIKIKEQKKP